MATVMSASVTRKQKFDPFVTQQKNAFLGSRHCQSSAFGGKTHDALVRVLCARAGPLWWRPLTTETCGGLACAQGWIGEGEWGSFLFVNGQFTAKLDEQLKAKGITDDDWATICSLLRKGKGRIVVDARDPVTGQRSLFGFSKAIKLVNELYLEPLGCIGVYSEYRNGMKAMAVYTKEAWDAKPASRVWAGLGSVLPNVLRPPA